MSSLNLKLQHDVDLQYEANHDAWAGGEGADQQIDK